MSNERSSLSRARLQHRFFVVTSGVLLLIALIGFSPSFFLKVFFQGQGSIAELAELLRSEGGEGPPAGTSGLPFRVYAHGALLTAWFVVFFVQTVLIASRRQDLHRRLGAFGLLLAVPVVVSTAVTTLLAIPRLVTLANLPDPAVVLPDNLPLVFANFATLVVFTIAVGSAALLRRRPEIHKRLMLLASFVMMTPAMDRVWGWTSIPNASEIWFPRSILAMVIVVIASDWLVRRRTPWVLLGGFVFWIILESIAVGFGTTDTARSWALALMS